MLQRSSHRLLSSHLDYLVLTMLDDASDSSRGLASVLSLPTSPVTEARMPPHEPVSPSHSENGKINILVESEIFAVS